MTQELAARSRRQLFNGRFFRREALAHRFRRRAGSVFVRTPLTTQVIAILALLTIFAIGGVLCFGRITPYVMSNGVLLPKGGIEQVVAPREGVIASIHANIGERVSAGQVLFTMTVSPSPEAALKLANRVIDLQRVAQARTALWSEDHSLQARRAAWRDEKKSYLAILELLDAERRSAGAGLRSTTALRGLEIEREKSLIQIQLVQGEARQTEAEIRAPQVLAQLRTALAADEAALAADEPDRSLRVVAVRDGILSNLLPLVGDTVAANTPIASITSTDSTVLANVFLPSTAVDYAAPGDCVQVRLRDFPVERFGSVPGRIAEISQLPVTREELDALHIAAPAPGPLFKATLVLGQQFISVDGTRRPLHAGMLVDVEVGQTSRPLWSFILHDSKHHNGKQAI